MRKLLSVLGLAFLASSCKLERVDPPAQAPKNTATATQAPALKSDSALTNSPNPDQPK